MIRINSNVESIRLSAYHLVKAFLPEEEVIQICEADEEMRSRRLALAQRSTKPAGGRREYLRIDDDNEKCIVNVSGMELDKKYTDLMVYDMFRDYTGIELPWGVLTGVRPVKLARASLGKMDRSVFLAKMASERRVSRAKAGLSWDIAQLEDNVIKGALGGKSRDLNSYSLYVGIPICPSICSYCSFSSGVLSVWSGRMDAYVEAMCRELNSVSEMCRGKRLTSIYIGGGTPTVLNEKQQEKLMNCLCRNFPVESTVEYTLEAGRPDTITENKLKIALDWGVSRISINPQTMQQKTLDAIGRKHTIEDVAASYLLARRMGYDNINMDLIAGLEGEGVREMQDTLRKIERLEPDSLTVHALALKRSAKLERLEIDADVVTQMIEEASRGASRMGMRPYYLYRQKSIAGNHENIGYAIPGKESIYNIMIMEEVQSIIACGAGATSKMLLGRRVQNPDRAEGVMTDLLRQDNVSRINEYIDRIDEMIEQKQKKLFDNIDFA